MSSVKPETLRCAAYTRKSSDEGLDRAFNSLDAQREACAAYVTSQVHEGWKLIPAQYDDGGYSGGNMQRPALQHLLADIVSGTVDVVVVYKIDRLTRSLADFARMVELLDKHQVSFVSVIQSFNTTSSMGRLTLNVLLSFAQFEREVTGERIRDKIAASKAKGMWMGGVPPLGYDIPEPGSRALKVNESEAETVRLIFRQYLELGSVRLLDGWLKDEGYTSKKFTSAAGKATGGSFFNRGALYRLLRNGIYRGRICHQSILYPGQHAPIVAEALFDGVQYALDANRRRSAQEQLPRKAARSSAPLTGRIYDAAGQPMSPTHSIGKCGKRYSYYVSSSLQNGSASQSGGGAAGNVIRRISAQALEYQLAPLLARLAPGHRNDPLFLPSRIEVHASAVHLTLPKSACPGIESRLASDERIENDVTDPKSLRLIAAVRICNRRGCTEIRSAGIPTSSKDPVLIGALRRAHSMVDLDARQLPVCHQSPGTQYGRRLLALAFLAPDLQRAILDGTQPADLNLDHLMAKLLAAEWSAQRQLFQHI